MRGLRTKLVQRWLLAWGFFAAGSLLVSCEKGSRREIIDGVEHIFHPEKTKPADIQLSLELTIGEELAGEEYLLGAIQVVATDDSGSVYIVDGREPRARVYKKEGTYLRTIGRRGEGPGELQAAGGIAPIRRGQVVVSDAGTQKLVFFDSAGNYLRELRFRFPLMGAPLLLEEAPDGGLVGLRPWTGTVGGEIGTAFVLDKSEADSGKTVVEYRKALGAFDPNDFWWFQRQLSRFAIDQTGRVFRAPFLQGEEIRIERYERDGRLSLVVVKACTPGRSIPEGELPEGAEEFPPYGDVMIGIDHKGRLWTQVSYLCRPQRPEFDVFTSDGEYVGHVQAAAFLPGVNLEMLAISGDKLLGSDPYAKDTIRLCVLRIEG